MFKQEWNLGDIDEVLKKVDASEFIRTLAYIGEQIINKARAKGEFTDRSGALRSSEGYMILMDGKMVNLKFNPTIKAEGKNRGEDLAKELAKENNKGIQLIVFAGMEYALYVESKGFDVLSGSVLNKSEFEKELKSLLA